MDVAKCPSCGTLLGSGVLAGQCPRCLLAGATRGGFTDDPDAQRQFAAAAVLSAVDQPVPDSHTDFDADADSTEDPSFPDVSLDDDTGRLDESGPRRAASWSDRAPGPRIEGYEVLRELNHGGQGVVYLAVQLATKRKVAVKVLLAGIFASKAARRRFEREIELVAGLNHPNVIAVFDSGTTHDGHDYYVMDYVCGVPFTQYVREKELDVGQVLSLFAATCEAVNHAHLRGVIHRDLKPSNLLVDAEGNVRVLDFGLAKALIDPAESFVSVTGNVVGTFPYMSPEQTRANPDEMDTRTDVYALGVVLYEALTGTHPYPVTGNVADVVRHIVETPPEPASRAWSGSTGVRRGTGRRPGRGGRCPVDSDLETILLKALSKEREQRYDNAGHFARDVRRYLADEPIIARKPSLPYQARMFSRRHRALVVASLGIFLGLVAGMIATTWVALELRLANARLIAANESIGNFMAFGGDDQADRGDLIAARRLYTKALDEASNRRLAGSSILAGMLEIGGRDGGVLPLLGSYGQTAGAGGFLGHRRRPTSVALLHGRRLALTSHDDGTLALWDPSTGRLVDQARTPAKRLAYVAVSADERWAVTAGQNGAVTRWDVSSDKLGGDRVLFEYPEEIWMVAISPDGRRVLAGTNNKSILLWEDGHLRAFDEKLGESVAALAFPPGDSRYALSSDGYGKITLWDLDTRSRVWKKSLDHGGYQINCIAFSRDGRKVVSASFDGSVMVWDVLGSGAAMTLKGRAEATEVAMTKVWRAAFSPDGRTVAAACEDGSITLLDAASQAPLRKLGAQYGGVMGVEFLDDDTLVSTGDDERDATGRCVNSALMVWDTRAGVDGHVNGAVSRLSVDDGGAVTVESPAGRAQLYIGRDGGLHAERKEGGPAAAPWQPATHADTPPSWAQGGRSGAAPAAGTTLPAPQAPLASLNGGAVRFYGGVDGTVQLWATPRARPGTPEGTPVLMRTLGRHKGRVTAAAVSDKGRYLVSGDENGGVKAWDLERPQLSREMEPKVQAALTQLATDPSSAAARSELDRWFEFRGRKILKAPAPAGGPGAATD